MPELGLRDREVAGRGSEHACVWLHAMMSRALNASQAGNERQTSGRGWRVEGIHCLRRTSESSSRGQREEREREKERESSVDDQQQDADVFNHQHRRREARVVQPVYWCAMHTCAYVIHVPHPHCHTFGVQATAMHDTLLVWCGMASSGIELDDTKGDGDASADDAATSIRVQGALGRDWSVAMHVPPSTTIGTTMYHTHSDLSRRMSERIGTYRGTCSHAWICGRMDGWTDELISHTCSYEDRHPSAVSLAGLARRACTQWSSLDGARGCASSSGT